MFSGPYVAWKAAVSDHLNICLAYIIRKLYFVAMIILFSTFVDVCMRSL